MESNWKLMNGRREPLGDLDFEIQHRLYFAKYQGGIIYAVRYFLGNTL